MKRGVAGGVDAISDRGRGHRLPRLEASISKTPLVVMHDQLVVIPAAYPTGLGVAASFFKQQRGHVTAAGCRAQILCQGDKRPTKVVTHRTRLCMISRDPIQQAACGAAITRPEVHLSARSPKSFERNCVSIVNRSAVTLQQFQNGDASLEAAAARTVCVFHVFLHHPFLGVP